MKTITRVLPVAMMIGMALPPALAVPRISEIQAANKDTIKDNDGQSSDWVEIFNPDAVTVSLAGMALTDDPFYPQKWVFPPGVNLPSRGSLLVWCSGKNRTVAAAPLHTNFDLAAEGEYLSLLDVDGVTPLSEFNPYPAQPDDRSYGSGQPIVTSLPIAAGTACRWTAPAAAISNWPARTFVDSAWTAAVTGIGYDRNTADGNFLPLIGAGGNTEAQMFNLRTTCYLRVPFNIAAPAAVEKLKLSVKFNDGFAAWLNGTKLTAAEHNLTIAPVTPAFNSPARTGRLPSDSLIAKVFDISDQRNLLVAGTNVLAIQGMISAIDSVDFLVAPELEVQALDYAAAATAGFFEFPSPGVENRTAPVSGFIDAPDFSVKRGFFTTAFPVTLTTNTSGAEIRYTTDGSTPLAGTGNLYTAPVNISTTTVLRAGAFMAGRAPSTVKTHTYLFADQVKNQPAAPAGFPATWGWRYNQTTGVSDLDPLQGNVPADYRMDPAITNHATYSPLIVPGLTTTLPVMCLSMDTPTIFGFDGIYANGRLIDEYEFPGSVEYFQPAAADDKWQENCGVRIHGGNSPVQHPKKPFRLYFRGDYGTKRLNYPLYPGSPVDKFDILQLRPGGHDGWSVPFGAASNQLAYHATYCRDRFCRDTETAMGRLSPRSRFVHLYINALYWGVYDLHEVPNATYYSDYVGGEEADWDFVQNPQVGGQAFATPDGTAAAFQALLNLCAVPLNLTSDAVYQSVQQYLDVNEFIDHMIVMMWAGSNDWVGPVYRGAVETSWFFNKNWDAGRRSRGPSPGRFLWNAWDAEISMGSSLNLGGLMQITNFDHTRVGSPSANGTGGPPAVIYHALRNNAAFRARFADRLQRHLFNGGALTAANNNARLQGLRNELTIPIVSEAARWGDVNGTVFARDSHWVPEMEWLKNVYIPGRNQTLLGQFQNIGIWPASTAPSLSQHGGIVAAGYNLAILNPNAGGGTVYYTLDGTDPMSTPAATPITLVNGATPAIHIVPAAQYAGNSWKNAAEPADVASWTSGAAGIGYDANPTFGPHITTTVAGMRNVRSSCYLRIPFTITAEQKANLRSLVLNLKYDDGAYVFLNGSAPLHRPNAPLTSPLYTDTATVAHTDTGAIVPQAFDLTSQIGSLSTSGPNLLAIQGLNVSTADDDFLCVPELAGVVQSTPPAAAGAQTYTVPVTLNQTITVKARVLLNNVWSPMTEASFIVGVPANASNVTVTEFSYNPAAPSAVEISAGFNTAQMFEFIELMNISADIVQLTGVRFDDGITFDFNTHSSVQQLMPGQRIVLASNPAALQMRYNGVPVAGTFAEASNLSNSGERMEILSASGAAIVDFVYDDNSPWPVAPDGEGYSLVLIDPLNDPDPVVPANWRASAGPASPGGSDADTFPAWATRHAVPNQMAADSNGNGLTNLVEYGLGLNPASSGTSGFLSARIETLSGVNYLVVRYRKWRAADDVITTAETSTDLLTWTPLVEAAAATVENADGTDDVALRSSAPVSAEVHRYVRVTVRER